MSFRTHLLAAVVILGTLHFISAETIAARDGSVASLWGAPIVMNGGVGTFRLVEYANTDNQGADQGKDRYDVVRDIRHLSSPNPQPTDPNILVISKGDANSALTGYINSSGHIVKTFQVNFDGDEYTELAVMNGNAYMSGRTNSAPCPGLPTQPALVDGFVHRVDDMNTITQTFNVNLPDHYCYELVSSAYDEVVTVTPSVGGGYIWAGGSSEGTPADVDPAQRNRTREGANRLKADSVLVRLEADLNLSNVLALQFGTEYFDEILGAAVDGRGGIFVSGMTQGDICGYTAADASAGKLTLRHGVTCDQGNLGQPGGDTISRDAYVAHIIVTDSITMPGISELQIDWIYQFGTGEEESAKGIAFIDDPVSPKLYLSGRTEGNFIGTNELNPRNNDGWLIRIDLDTNLLPLNVNDVVSREIAQWGGELGDSHTRVKVHEAGDHTYLYLAGGQDNDFDHSDGSCFDHTDQELQSDPVYDDPNDGIVTTQSATYSSIQVLVWDITTSPEVPVRSFSLDGNQGDVLLGFDLTPNGTLLVSGQTTSTDLGGDLGNPNLSRECDNNWTKTGLWVSYAP